MVLILTGRGHTGAYKLAESIIQKVRCYDNSPYPGITISAGIASYPEDANTFEKLIKASDSALLEAKKTGKNKAVVFGSN